MSNSPLAGTAPGLRRAVAIVALLNLAYCGVEFSVALNIDSVSLFADSIDFFEDAAVNFLIFVALGWTAKRRARVGMLLAGILLLPALGFVWALWTKYQAPIPPQAGLLGVTGAGALVVNLFCALLLTQYRHHSGSLAKAAFLSARNDALANAAIILAGLATAWRPSIWPDLVVGVGIAWTNADAAKEVWRAARDEHHSMDAKA